MREEEEHARRNSPGEIELCPEQPTAQWPKRWEPGRINCLQTRSNTRSSSPRGVPMQEKHDADAVNGETTSSVADPEATVAADTNVEELCSFVAGFLPGVPARDLLAALECKPVAEMRAEWPEIATIAEPWLLTHWASPGASPEERLVYPLLRRKWPAIKAAVESLLETREKNPALSWFQVFDRWFPQAPKGVISLFELPHALWLESIDGATGADAPDAVAFAKDLQALVTAAERVQERWLANESASPSQERFRAQVADRISEIVRIFTGIPQVLGPSAFGPLLSNPLPQVFAEARRRFGNSVSSVASQGRLFVMALKKILPDHPVAIGHRPTTSQRDHRLMLLADAGAQIHEIAKYVSARIGEPFSEGAVHQAIIRARQRVAAASSEGPALPENQE